MYAFTHTFSRSSNYTIPAQIQEENSNFSMSTYHVTLLARSPLAGLWVITTTERFGSCPTKHLADTFAV